MDPRESMRNLGTGDVEIGFGPMKRRASEASGWVCEHCGTNKPQKAKGTEKPCTSKSGRHKWRSA